MRPESLRQGALPTYATLHVTCLPLRLPNSTVYGDSHLRRHPRSRSDGLLLDMRLQVRLASDHGEVAAGKRGGRTRGSRAVRAHDAARFEESALEANNKWETKMYAALGIDDSRNGISRKELDRAYRKCALRWHPDKFHGNTSDGEKREATRRFVEAADAYRRLTTTGG